jgi:hypothetical protein
MKKLISRYRGLDGIVKAALDATLFTALICLAIIATL